MYTCSVGRPRRINTTPLVQITSATNATPPLAQDAFFYSISRKTIILDCVLLSLCVTGVRVSCSNAVVSRRRHVVVCLFFYETKYFSFSIGISSRTKSYFACTISPWSSVGGTQVVNGFCRKTLLFRKQSCGRRNG